MISLFYLMVYLHYGGKLPKVNIDSLSTFKLNRQLVLNAKENHRIPDLCFDDSKELKHLMIEIFSIDYAEQPTYITIKLILSGLIEKEKRNLQK